MHIKRIPQQMRLMPPALPQTLPLRPLKVIQQYRPIIRMRRLFNNHPRPLPRTQSPHIRQPLLRHHDIEIMLRLVDMRAHGHDAAHARRIRLARPRARRMHDAVLGGAQKVRRAPQTVEHARAHDAGRVRVGINVHLDGRVHADDAQPPDDLGRVRDLLRAQQQLRVVRVPVAVEALEALGREADAARGRKVEVAAVEEVEEGVLQHLGPDFQVAEVGAAVREAADDGVGDVADAGLDGEQVAREPAAVDFVLEELDQVVGDGARGGVFGRVGLGLVRVVGFDEGDDFFGVDGDVGGADAVLGRHDEVGFAVGWEVHHDDVVEAFEGWGGGVDFDDDFVGHLDQFWTRAYTGTGNDAAVFCDGACFYLSVVSAAAEGSDLEKV